MEGIEDISPDRPLTTDQQALADSLDPAVVANVDAILLSHARNRGRKVAMLVGLTMAETEVAGIGLPDKYYADRVKSLIEVGKLVAIGDPDYMRHCEVFLPQDGDA